MKNVLLVLLFLLAQLPTYAQAVRLTGAWKFHIGDEAHWADPSFDDNDWERIHVPAAWEDEGFNGYDGFAWYRRKFDGNALDKEETYFLNLGFIDDCDEVYINGVLVGVSGTMPPRFKTAYQTERKYNIPSEIIRYNGPNIIAIRVFDVIHGGGIIDGNPGIYLAPKSRLLFDLAGLWQFKRTRTDKRPTPDSNWGTLMVPAAWEHQGHYKYDGYAWYHKTFSIPATVADAKDELLLLMGKIDDFDKTYLNGQLIGQTNDHEEYGNTESYQQLRVYAIPRQLLKKEDNLLEVFVDDLGNVGGIYEGPVGIVTRSTYERYFRKTSFWRFNE